MEKKYELTEETLVVGGHILHRIVALRDFGNIKKGDLGGFIEKEANLADDGNCWIFDNAKVYDNAEIYGNAKVHGYAKVYGYAKVHGYAIVYGDAEVCGKAIVYGYAEVYGDAIVEKKSDYIVFKNWWSSGRYFTWTRSNDRWAVGCFYGTGEELIKKAYNDSDESGREYERIVKYVESIKSEIK